MNIKRHRVVSNESPFQGVTNALQDRAIQCAENEGWPIPGDDPEPLLVMAQVNVVQCVTTRVNDDVRGGILFRSGRPCARQRIAPSTRQVVAIQWSANLQASRP
jgi:hypothetical protein